MQVDISPEKTKFQPVKLSITFESEQELKVFHTMVKADSRIPNKLRDDRDLTSYESEILAKIMWKLHLSINSLKG